MARHKDVTPVNSHYAPLRYGSGSPQSVVTATVIGETYVDTSVAGKPIIYVAEAASNSNWVVASASPVTTQGDIIIGNAQGAEARLAVGTNGQVLKSNGTTVEWSSDVGFTNPMTAEGDVIIGSTAGAAARLAVGSSGQVLQSNGTTATWSTPHVSPITTQGDVIVGDAGGAEVRLAIGTNGQVLTSNGTTAAWSTPPAGGNNLIHLNTMEAISGANIDAATDSIILEDGAEEGISFGKFQVPSNWAGTGTFALHFLMSTPAGATGNMRFRLDYKIIKAGEPVWATAGYTAGTAVNIAVASQTTYQKLDNATLSIPNTGLSAGNFVYVRLYREGDDAGNDTHGEDAYVNAGYIAFTAA